MDLGRLRLRLVRQTPRISPKAVPMSPPPPTTRRIEEPFPRGFAGVGSSVFRKPVSVIVNPQNPNTAESMDMANILCLDRATVESHDVPPMGTTTRPFWPNRLTLGLISIVTPPATSRHPLHHPKARVLFGNRPIQPFETIRSHWLHRTEITSFKVWGMVVKLNFQEQLYANCSRLARASTLRLISDP